MKFLDALKNKHTRIEYLKFSIVGILSTLIDYLITALILYIEGKEHFKGFFGVFLNKTVDGIAHKSPISVYITATMIGFTLSILFNYVMSIFFVYQYGNVGKTKRGFIKFVAFALIGLALTTASSLIGYAGFKGNIWIVKIITTVIVFIFNFFTRKFLVFNINLIRDDDHTINL